MTARWVPLRLVPPIPAPPEIKDVTGEDIPCLCVCGLWVHVGICTDWATTAIKNPDGSWYTSCEACLADMREKEKDL